MFSNFGIDAFHMHLKGDEMDQILTDEKIEVVLRAFYERVREDPQLAEVFSVVEDWDEHITRLSEFWSSLMFTSGRYKGNPVSMHLVHRELIEPEMFDRWLELWEKTTSELVARDIALQMQAKASRIAARLSRALFDQPSLYNARPCVSVAGIRPYKVTSSFDEKTVPAALLRDHNLKAGSWGLIRIEDGALQYREGDRSVEVNRDNPGIIPPVISHHLEIIGPVKFTIEFYDQRPVAPLH